MPTGACPTREELSAYLVGKLLTARSEEIDMHLQACPDCQQSLETINAKSDTLLSELHQSREPSQYLEEPQCQQALARVEALGCDPSLTSFEQRAESLGGGLFPRQIGPYRLLEQLGRGGMGTVYKALHTRLDRIVALKLLPNDRLHARDALQRFEREMKAVGKLDHPNIVRASDADEEDGLHYLVMECVDGLDLAELSRRAGPLAIADACELIRQAAVGLEHAHEHGLVHRDIKPSNLMVCHGASDTQQPMLVKILDLGLALLSDSIDQSELTSTGQTMGTLDYMAPEQCDDSHAVDIRADIYSLGATLYKLLSGEPIFSGSHYQKPLQKLRALATEAAPPIQGRRGDIPDELAAVVERMVARDPQERFATPAAVAAALAPFCLNADLARLMAEHSIELPHRASDASTATLPNLLKSDAETDRTQPPPDLAVAPGRPRRPGWPGKIAAMLALGGFAAALAGLVFYIQTPHGTVQITINDPTISVVLDGQGATIQGADKQHEIKVQPGQHGLTITRDGFTFETKSFTLRRGETTRLDIKFVDQQIRVKRGDDLLDEKPLPASDPPPPVADLSRPPAPQVGPEPAPNDYDHLATGRWVPVLTASGKPVERRNAVMRDGLIEVQNGHAYDSSIRAADLIVRAQVKKQQGQIVMLTLRDVKGVYYSAFYQCDWGERFGIGMRGVRFHYDVKQHFEAAAGVKEGEFFELAFAAIGDKLTVYAGGKLVGELRDTAISHAGGVAVHTTKGQGVFKDVEVMILDNPAPAATTSSAATPPSSATKPPVPAADPDRKAPE